MKTHYELVDVEFWQPMPGFEVFPVIDERVKAWVAELNKRPRPKGPRYQVFRVNPESRLLMGMRRNDADRVEF